MLTSIYVVVKYCSFKRPAPRNCQISPLGQLGKQSWICISIWIVHFPISGPLYILPCSSYMSNILQQANSLALFTSYWSSSIILAVGPFDQTFALSRERVLLCCCSWKNPALFQLLSKRLFPVRRSFFPDKQTSPITRIFVPLLFLCFYSLRCTLRGLSHIYIESDRLQALCVYGVRCLFMVCVDEVPAIIVKYLL